MYRSAFRKTGSRGRLLPELCELGVDEDSLADADMLDVHAHGFGDSLEDHKVVKALLTDSAVLSRVLR